MSLPGLGPREIEQTFARKDALTKDRFFRVLLARTSGESVFVPAVPMRRIWEQYVMEEMPAMLIVEDDILLSNATTRVFDHRCFALAAINCLRGFSFSGSSETTALTPGVTALE